MLYQVAVNGLGVTIEEGSYSALVDVMGHLMAVKDRQHNTDNLFEPLKQTIELLKTYDQDMSEEIYHQLQVLQVLIIVFYVMYCQELPEQWNNVKKLSAVMKQTVAPLQANEVNIIRRKLATFDVS